MRAPEDSNWRLFADFLSYVRMPLFASISGYFFNTVALSWTNVGILLKSKVRRLGIPLIVVSYLFYVTSCLVGTNFCIDSPWQVLVLPYAHFWFLQSILIIMIVVTVASLSVGGNIRLLTSIVLPVSAILTLSGFGFSVNVFSINNAIYLFPFFLLGLSLRAWSIVGNFDYYPGERQVTLIILGVVLIFFWIILFHSTSGPGSIETSRRTVFGLSLSMLSCLFLFLLRLPIRPLAFIGPFSFAIYLFHPFFTSASRRILLAIDASTPRPVLFGIGLLVGIICPLVLHQIFVRYRITALLLLGINTSSLSNRPNQNCKA